MNKIPFFGVDQDISIVSILDLENIGDDTICSLWFDEIFPCFLEPDVIFGPKVGDKELIETLLIGFPNGVPGDSLGHNLDNTPNIQCIPSPITNRLIWKQFKLKIMPLKYLSKQPNHL